MAFVKDKRLNYNRMSFRELIIAFFAHWTGYASNGFKTGISSNPTASRIENYLCDNYPEWGDNYYEDNGLHMKLMNKVTKIEDEFGEITYASPYNVDKRIAKAWPKIEKFLETTPLIKDDIQRESKMKNITFNQLKKFIKEANEQPKTWRGVSGTKWIWNGEWADPEVEYDGETINANDLEDFVFDQYQLDCKYSNKEATEADFDSQPISWFKEQLDEYMFGVFGDR